MKKNLPHSLFFIVLVISFSDLFIFNWPSVVYGIGQMAEPIVIENALKGEEYTNQLILLNTEAVPVKFGLSAEGDIANWTTFYRPEDLNTPIKDVLLSAKANMPVMAKILVPKIADNKTYVGKINAFTMPDSSNPQGETVISVKLAVPRSVTIAVTGIENKTVSCQIIPQSLYINSGDPLTVSVWCKNTGNVSVKPLVRLIVNQNNNQVDEKAFIFPDEKKQIIPNALVNWDVSWSSTGRNNGQYDLKAQILIDDEVVQESQYGLTIRNKTYAMLSAALLTLWKSPSGFVAALIFASLVVGLIFYFVRKRLKSSVGGAAL